MFSEESRLGLRAINLPNEVLGGIECEEDLGEILDSFDSSDKENSSDNADNAIFSFDLYRM